MFGSGTIGDPYIIQNASDLQDMELDLDAYYELGGDINASAINFNPVGTGVTPFIGQLDGKGFTIWNLTINIVDNTSLGRYIGLFGWLAGIAAPNTGTIKNVSLVDANVTATLSRPAGASGYVGCLVGWSGKGASISNCHASGTIVATSKTASIAGGLLGESDTNTISQCSADVDVLIHDNGYAGGFIGTIYKGDISESFALGDVESTVQGARLGGFGGNVTSTATLSNCYARGCVTAANPAVSWDAGGFASVVSSTSTISKCYSTGAVNCTNGGFIQSLQPGGVVLNCYWDKETSGQTASDAGTGKTTDEMKTQSTFSDWDFEIIWNLNSICNDGYPCLLSTTPSCPFSQITNISYTAKHIVTLEALRNIEMSALGRVYVDEEGRVTYKSRYARNR